MDCSPISSAIQARYSGKWHNIHGETDRLTSLDRRQGWENAEDRWATLNLSSGDLVGHLNCRYLTELDLKVANGELEKPKIWDPVLEALVERGALHEQGFIEHIKAGGIAVTLIDGVGVDSRSVAATGEAMARGDAIIVQGALQAGRWSGRTDVLTPSGNTEPFRRLVVRSNRHQTRPGNEGQHGPSDIPVLRPAFEDAGGRAGLRLSW